MKKSFAALGSATWFVLAPGIVGGLAPWWISQRGTDTASLGWPLQSLGVMLIVAGASVLVDCLSGLQCRPHAPPATTIYENSCGFPERLVGNKGLTAIFITAWPPAPVFPIRRLVVAGLYRFVRNPMYLGVVAVILGQSLLLGNARVLEYGGLVLLGFHGFVLLYEEASLRATHGNEYEKFCLNVPRWIHDSVLGGPSQGDLPKIASARSTSVWQPDVATRRGMIRPRMPVQAHGSIGQDMAWKIASRSGFRRPERCGRISPVSRPAP